jgi:hypothetical protein
MDQHGIGYNMSYTGTTPRFKNVIETEPLNPVVPILDIDWLEGDVHHQDISVDTAYTFSNAVDGKTILIIINNTDVGAHAITFPAGIKVNGDFDGNVEAMTETVFTLVKSNSKLYMTEIKELA